MCAAIAAPQSLIFFCVCALMLALFLSDALGLAKFQAQHEAFVQNKVASADPLNVKPVILAMSRISEFHPSWRYSIMATLVFVFVIALYRILGGLEKIRSYDMLVLAFVFWMCTDCVVRYRLCHVEGATWRGVEALVAPPGSLSCFWSECVQEAKSANIQSQI